MILPDEYTTSVTISLIILAMYATIIFLLFEIKIRIEGEFSKAFTFLVLGVITRMIVRVIDLLDRMGLVGTTGFLSDILTVLFATFLLLFTIKMYTALKYMTDGGRARQERIEPEGERQIIREMQRIKQSKKTKADSEGYRVLR